MVRIKRLENTTLGNQPRGACQWNTKKEGFKGDLHGLKTKIKRWADRDIRVLVVTALYTWWLGCHGFRIGMQGTWLDRSGSERTREM
jgi:hypothetical protein